MKHIYVVGLEGSGTRWVRDILEFVVGPANVTHYSLPRNWIGDGRYFHGPDKIGNRQDACVLLVIRDSSIAMRSNLKFNDWDIGLAESNRREASRLMKAYVAHPEIETHVFSYESAMFLGDAYTHPLIARVTGKVFPTWNCSINYSDGNDKYLKEVGDGKGTAGVEASGPEVTAGCGTC